MAAEKHAEFQLTRLMRGVTIVTIDYNFLANISTHTPHARRDAVKSANQANLKISTHTPHARRDIIGVCLYLFNWKFQLTRLMRGVTQFLCRVPDVRQISTHTPHARRDKRLRDRHKRTEHISTHTPHARRDRISRSSNRRKLRFQLTRLMRGVTFFSQS